jgi:hypothetical protein
VASGSLFYWLKARVPSDDVSDLRVKRSVKFASLAFAMSALSTVSLFGFIALTSLVGQAEDTRRFGLLVLGTVLVVHASANITRFGNVPVVTMFLCLLYIVISAPLGVSLYGGLSLRILGIGGGLPREVTLRTYEVTSGGPLIRTLNGCVLIKTGDEIAIHPTLSPSECQLTRVLHDSFANRSQWAVEVYPASMVVQVRNSFLTTHAALPSNGAH